MTRVTDLNGVQRLLSTLEIQSGLLGPSHPRLLLYAMSKTPRAVRSEEPALSDAHSPDEKGGENKKTTHQSIWSSAKMRSACLMIEWWSPMRTSAWCINSSACSMILVG